LFPKSDIAKLFKLTLTLAGVSFFNKMNPFRSSCYRRFSVIVTMLAGVAASAERPDVIGRSQTGLQVLYDFSSTGGDIVKDRAGVGKPVDLKISNVNGVERSAGSLKITGKAQIMADKPSARLVESIRRSGEVSIEAWITPENTTQAGPARIVSISADGSQRDITLGQEGDKYDIRLRTTQTGVNGIPSLTLQPNTVEIELTHVVYARDRAGVARVYLNGKQVAKKNIPGTTVNWELFRLTLADEFGGNRQWLGTYHLVAIYNRSLLPNEVKQNFEAGPDYKVSPGALAQNELPHGAKLFNEEIAPLLAKHCLECHDSAIAKGDLDLSRKDMAMAGSSSGTVIEPGKATESYLWKSVDTNEMPEDRTPLSQREKDLLKEWINEGAIWTTDQIDPVIYENEGVAEQNWVRRLTVPEYVETVRVAVGVDIEEEALEILPKDLRADGFSNTAYNLNVDMEHVNAYAQLAGIIVGTMDVPTFTKRFSQNVKFTDNDMGKLIEKMGKWLLRGPVEEHELVVYRGISTTVASAGGTTDEAISYIIEAMLQSPRFIYRIENQRGDGTTWPVGQYELASRLSYTIWGAPPDEELIRAADASELFGTDQIEAQAKRMLQDPRAQSRSVQFISEWLNLGRLQNLRPNAEKFPNWNPELADDMRDETIAFFEDVVWQQNRPLSDLLNAQLTYVTPRLAKHYGLKTESEEFTRYDLSDVPARGGLLTQGSVLTIGGDNGSMVTRGLFVLHDLLRGTVKDPPPGLDTTPVPSSPGQSHRVIAKDRIDNKSCGGCHSKFEPLAFGLEKFDGLGSFYEEDRFGNVLREDGEILFPGDAKPVAYETSEELMNLLANSGRVQETITWKLAQFALGRPLESKDVPFLDRIHETAQKNGGTYASLITAIVTSDLIRTTRTESDDLASN